MNINASDWTLERHDNSDGTIQYEVWGTVGDTWGRIICIEEDDWPNAKAISDFIFKAIKLNQNVISHWDSKNTQPSKAQSTNG